MPLTSEFHAQMRRFLKRSGVLVGNLHIPNSECVVPTLVTLPADLPFAGKQPVHLLLIKLAVPRGP